VSCPPRLTGSYRPSSPAGATRTWPREGSCGQKTLKRHRSDRNVREAAAKDERHRSEGDAQMRACMIRATVKADKAAALGKSTIEAFAAVGAAQSQRVHYASCELPGGESCWELTTRRTKPSTLCRPSESSRRTSRPKSPSCPSWSSSRPSDHTGSSNRSKSPPAAIPGSHVRSADPSRNVHESLTSGCRATTGSASAGAAA
jgi:hypothetical protein